MYGMPQQTYAVLNNVFYPADGNRVGLGRAAAPAR
jgi:hypothetical protein